MFDEIVAKVNLIITLIDCTKLVRPAVRNFFETPLTAD